jgi:hypothetical protein
MEHPRPLFRVCERAATTRDCPDPHIFADGIVVHGQGICWAPGPECATVHPDSTSRPPKPTIGPADWTHGDNIFALLGSAQRALRRAGQDVAATEMLRRVDESAHSYEEAIAIVGEFVVIR